MIQSRLISPIRLAVILEIMFFSTFILYGFIWAVESWSYGSCMYNYRCNQCLSPQMLWVWIPLRRGVLDITLCDKVCQWLATGRIKSFFCFSTNKTDHHDITEIFLKVVLNTIKQTLIVSIFSRKWNVITCTRQI